MAAFIECLPDYCIPFEIGSAPASHDFGESALVRRFIF